MAAMAEAREIKQWRELIAFPEKILGHERDYEPMAVGENFLA